MFTDNDTPVARLAVYWLRADVMHELVHNMRGNDLTKLPREEWIDFETYLDYWLSALFVVVEGFNKLKLRDAGVQKLFDQHVGYLKQVRHETYHFTVGKRNRENIIAALNWAEDLHEAIGDHVRKIISREVDAEKILELRESKI